MKKHIFLFSLLCVALFSACEDKGKNGFVIPPTFEDPVENPIKSAQAQDGNEWIEGTIAGRVITFAFRALEGDQLKSVQVRFTAEEGASMTNPATSPAALDLTADRIVTASNGYSDIEYTVKATEFPLLKGVTVKIGGETNYGSPDSDKNIVITSFAADMTVATVTLDLSDGVNPVSPATAESVQNLSSPLTIKVKDSKTGGEKQYTLTINTDWQNATAELTGDDVSLPDCMTIYRNTKLHGREGNTGFVVKIPAGKVDMKVSHKIKPENTWFLDDQRMSNVVAANPDYGLFVAGVRTQYWKPIVLNLAINDGAVADNGYNEKSVPWRHWNIKYYTCPPTLGVKDGKAAIAYADVMADEKLYKFAQPQHGEDKSLFMGSVLWDVDTAVSGYAMPLKNGEVQISGESASSYKALADLERNHIFNNVKDGMQNSNFAIDYNGEDRAYLSAYVLDGLRMARTMVGVTAQGDLMVFVSERYSTTNNALVTDGDSSDGSTMQEAATVLKEFGCTDAMALGQIFYAVAAMQDGASGKDLTRTIQRTDIAAGQDLNDGVVVMFKGFALGKNYGAPNSAGTPATETDPYTFD